MPTCYYCETEITNNNKSREHIIHEFLGGNLTSTELLCKKCNSNLGQTIDADFYEQLKPFANLIVTKNQKKEFREKLVDKNGEEYYVRHNMYPLSRIYIKDANNNTEKILHVKDEAALEKEMTRKKMEASGKFNVSKIYKEEPPKNVLFFTNSLTRKHGEIGFGGPSYHKSIVKIAVNYYLSFGYDRKYVVDAIKLIKGEEKVNRLSSFFYPRHFQVHYLAEGEVSNIIYLVGDREQRLLFCYVEFLSSECLIVKLNMDYDGPEILEQYIFDVVAQTDIEKRINIQLLRHHIEFIYLIKNTDIHEKLHNRLVSIIAEKQNL